MKYLPFASIQVHICVYKYIFSAVTLQIVCKWKGYATDAIIAELLLLFVKNIKNFSFFKLHHMFEHVQVMPSGIFEKEVVSIAIKNERSSGVIYEDDHWI